MRGKPSTGTALGKFSRSIPAHAGETHWPAYQGIRSGVNPRSCGGNNRCTERMRARRGQSPLMRGKLGRGTMRLESRGSIPAHAGETASISTNNRIKWVNPRSCGGNERLRAELDKAGGQSPLMRGKYLARRKINHGCGSIPAHAGETHRVTL